MKPKFKQVLAIFFVGFYAIMTLIGTGEKLLQTQHLIDSFKPLQIVEYSRILGVIDLIFSALFLIPKTRKMGFLLSSCYLAGAMGAHISHHVSPIQPLAMMVILWISAFLLNKSLLFQDNKSIN
tara:strand:+ start:13434 stop:13805 length:372 start_codon:yes stop_codon:yes gene_type:complete